MIEKIPLGGGVKTVAKHYDPEDLLQIILKGLTPLGVERVPLSSAAGRTLAWDLTALRDRPVLPISPVNGYALRAADLTGARRHRPVTLTLADHIGPGLAVPVYAGQPLPVGCDAVVPRSDTDGGSPNLSVYCELWPYDNYIRPGTDYRSGDLLLPAETVLDAAALCLLSGAGYDDVPLRVRPQVEVLPGPGTGGDSLLYLTTLLTAWGVELEGEEPPQFTVLLGPTASLAESELICVPTVSPCGVLALSHCDRRPVLTLSDDPAELFKAASLLVRPMLAYLTGSHALLPVPATGQLDASLPRSSPVRRFLPAHYDSGRVTPPAAPLVDLPAANCLVDLPAGTPALPVGSQVSVLLL